MPRPQRRDVVFFQTEPRAHVGSAEAKNQMQVCSWRSGTEQRKQIQSSERRSRWLLLCPLGLQGVEVLEVAFEATMAKFL